MLEVMTSSTESGQTAQQYRDDRQRCRGRRRCRRRRRCRQTCRTRLVN